MAWSPRAWVLERLDGQLTESQRRLPPGELWRYRVLLGATTLLLVLNGLYLFAIPTFAPGERLPQVVAVGVCTAAYVSVLMLARRLSSPTLPSLLLCSALAAGFILGTLPVDTPGAVSHAVGMLIPALAVYLLGPRRGFFFTVLLVLYAGLFHQLFHSGFGRVRPLFHDQGVWMSNLITCLSLLMGWALSWLYGTVREESHGVLEGALKTLRESEGKLISVLESTEDVVVALDREGRVVTANQMAKALGQHVYGRKLERGGILDWMASPGLMELFQAALTGKRQRVEIPLTHEGRTLTLDVTFNPVWEGERVVGATLFSRDITERKEAEARLAELHRSLVDVSRHAGMAEIATGVLHNVGNTLNSVNVSANLVVDRLRASRAAGLDKAVELLRENASRLGAFFEEDPRGRQFPAYLAALSGQLAQERESVLEELRRLTESVDHIKSVVSMQQEHARFAGVLERVEVPGLLDDAMRLHAVSFDRLGIQLRREYTAAASAVMVDRHKLLQILVNLLSNARHALLESQQPDKQLTLRVEQAGERLRIAVADNGVGIAPENLQRLFSQGFTTKKDGHGFGLHISALSAEELGGSLQCESEGPGKGATFTLELPLA
ncbi:PAS domain S-box-containing protein [Archangium gephyra]|uniref:histidine kinase n=1 Tax=Archangium gephyra TaxID=48 RepID=A0AAC8TCH0_9BACT|nr:ATP-binding protein [Archangium gephyra]AKJ00977.1 sensor histidine kinase [Archangium gephyra]REG26142.1 PAS domain S-box-containing protein [Archangium gephyra]